MTKIVVQSDYCLNIKANSPFRRKRVGLIILVEIFPEVTVDNAISGILVNLQENVLADVDDLLGDFVIKLRAFKSIIIISFLVHFNFVCPFCARACFLLSQLYRSVTGFALNQSDLSKLHRDNSRKWSRNKQVKTCLISSCFQKTTSNSIVGL